MRNSRSTILATAVGYNVHYVVDGGKARIILAALVTPAAIMDNTPMLDLERWVRFRWHVQPHLAVGDTKYGTTANIVGLEQDGLRAYVAMADQSVRTKLYSQERFQYDAQNDGYVCPQEQFLPLSSFDQQSQAFMYRTSPKICNACSVKPECTTSRYGRVVRRSVFQDYVDRVHAYHATPAYQKAMRKRSVWIEPMFAEAKQWHQLTQFRLRRLDKVNIQALFTAAGQNIKRLLKLSDFIHPPHPAPAAVLALSSAALKYSCVLFAWLLLPFLFFRHSLRLFQQAALNRYNSVPGSSPSPATPHSPSACLLPRSRLPPAPRFWTRY